jgi:HEPN domain-containing protein
MRNNKNYEANRWFTQAKEDLKTTKVLIENERFYMACFLAQQTAEKSLKAFLYNNGETFVFGHSVSKLCLSCSEYDASFKELRSKIKNLDQYYIEARYPNGLPDDIPAYFFDENDSLKAFEMAQKAINFVENHL